VRAPSGPGTHSTNAAPPARRSRHVPAHVEREVWKRDQGRCQWPIDGGAICGETYQVQVDHIPGFALGAGHTAAELRLLCRPHQDVHARKLYGDDLMDKYTGPKGGGCSEPVVEYTAARRPSTCARGDRGDGGGARPVCAGGPEPGSTLEGPGRSIAESPGPFCDVMWAGPRGPASRARHRFGRSLSFVALPVQAAPSAAQHGGHGDDRELGIRSSGRA
jgi:hypothetical protein